MKNQQNIEDIYPLTPLQQGLLFHTLYQAGEYTVQLQAILEGELDVVAFKAAWQILITRHAALRTAFFWEDLAQPLAVVYRKVEVAWHEADLEKDRKKSFDLTDVPLMRLSLSRLADNRYQFGLTYHHLLLDGWSVSRLLQEVAALYQNQTLPPLRPYRDYIAWLQKQDKNAAQLFWQKNLAGLQVPTVIYPARKNGYQTHEFSLDSNVAQSFATRYGLTLSSVVQGLWAILLSWYSGENDVIFGTTVAGRPSELSGIENTLGLFINTLPVRTLVDRNESLVDWLRKFQGQSAELRQYEYSSLVDIQGWSEIPRGTPLFESLLVFENYPVASTAWKLGDLTFKDGQLFERTNYPLTILVTPQLSFKLSCDGSRFEAQALSIIADHFKVALHSIADVSIAQLLSRLGHQQENMLARADLVVSLGEVDNLVSYFEEQAASNPQKVALRFEGKSLSYEELNKQANQLACHLQTLGVETETLVGVCLSRSPNLIIAMLAVLKAGGAYVPLDPTYPIERLSFMANDAQVKLILTEQDNPYIKAGEDKLVMIDEVMMLGGRDFVKPIVSRSSNLAYVIYTSGSTGQPKGVAIEQRSVINLIRWASAYYESSQLAGVLASTSVCFDLSVFEIFVPLSVGGTVILADNLFGLPTLPDKQYVTLVNTVPSLLSQLLKIGKLPPSVNSVNLAGEALPLELVEKVYQQATVRAVYNLYGPSETTVYSTCAKLTKDAGYVPIGKPILDTQIRVLDKYGQPVATGTSGELYIAGAGVGRGYLNQPDLTSERFRVDDVYGRIYKTGDLVRLSTFNELEFLGRLDQQIKLRGYRIEPSEIEGLLNTHPDIAQSVVVMQTSLQGQAVLVAYFVAKQVSPSSSQLQAFLKNKLPQHMIPTAFVALEVLPLTANGKLDRQALPALEVVVRRRNYVAASSDVQKQLVTIWQEVLGVKRVGILDNFFELGGHSLLALRLVAEVQKVFGRKISLAMLLESGTIEAMASNISQMVSSSPLVALKPTGDKPPFFCVHGSSGLTFGYLPLARNLSREQPFYGLQTHKPLASIEAMATYYLEAIQAVQNEGPYKIGGWSMGSLVAFEMARQLHEQGQEVALLALLDAPTIPYTVAGNNAARMLADFANEQGLAITFEELKVVKADQLAAYFVERTQPALGIEPELVQQILQISKANLAAMQSYVPQEYAGRITLFQTGGNHSQATWQAFSRKPVKVCKVGGNHFTMLQSASLAQQLQYYLDQK